MKRTIRSVVWATAIALTCQGVALAKPAVPKSWRGKVTKVADGDTVTYRWELKPESTATTGGGDYEEPLASLDGYLSDTSAATTVLTAPAPGKYRLFAWASDDEGRVAHANIPFLVEQPKNSL